jgi:hypothetical protein
LLERALLFSYANLARSVAGIPTPTDDYLICCSHEISVLILVVIALVACGAASLGLWALRALSVRPQSPQHIPTLPSPAAREYASPSKVAPLPLPSPQHPQPDSGGKVRRVWGREAGGTRASYAREFHRRDVRMAAAGAAGATGPSGRPDHLE